MNTATERQSTVIGAFEDCRQAEAAVGELRQAGFREEQIRVEEIRSYRGESETRQTGVTVQADGRADEAESILRRHGNGDVLVAPDAPDLRADEGATIQLHAEELHAHKQLIEAGEVRVRKEVVTEHRTLEVPVRREEIVIERRAPAGARVPATDIGPGQEIRIPVRKERVTVEKRPVVTEEVTVGKRVIQETERVGGEVRKEEVRVVRVEREENEAIPAEDEEAKILQRAYLKWLEEGRPVGQDRRHYFEAAREVRD